MFKGFKLLTVLCMGAVALPVAAQVSSPGFSFLQAVRERDGTKANELVAVPGSTVVNYCDDRECPLNVVTKGRDVTWMGFLIGKGARVDGQARGGEPALVDAARIGFVEGVNLLLRTGATVDLRNRAGETALNVAVQQRQLPVARRLIEAGANPDRTDNVGRSPRDYAKLDSRSAELLRIMETAKAKKPAEVAGPKL